MALGLDDKLLGEKMNYYCDSSEDEKDYDADEYAYGDHAKEPGEKSSVKESKLKFIKESEIETMPGKAINTGPKGVVNDWRRYKQLETEKREGQEKETQELLKKLSMTCRSNLDDEKEKEADAEFEELLEGLEDEFMKEYREKRLEEMRRAYVEIPKFGKVVAIQRENYIEEIDNEKANVTIIVHLYEDGAAGCEAMNGSLMCLAQEYPTVKFCKLKASDAKLSRKFSVKGVPALLIYRSRELIGNFVGLTTELGEDFFATDVESFLLEHGLLPDKTLYTAVAHQSSIKQSRVQEEDSDYDID